MRLSRFCPSLPGPRRHPPRPIETNPSSRLFRPSLPGPRRRPPRPLETSPSSRLFRRQHRRRQVPPVSAPASTRADCQHRRQQVSPVSAPARTRADQTSTSRRGRSGEPDLRPARPYSPTPPRSDVLSSSASDPPSSWDRESCIWAGKGGEGEGRAPEIPVTKSVRVNWRTRNHIFRWSYRTTHWPT